MAQRLDGSGDFYRDWRSYKQGFGLAHGEYWVGNEYLHYLTRTRAYTLRFELEGWEDNTSYATYSSFVVASEAEKYRLLLGDYSGTASANQAEDYDLGFLFHYDTMFSTYDQDNDVRRVWSDISCILTKGFGGFWMNDCLNVGFTNYYAVNNTMPPDIDANNCIRWNAWLGGRTTLKTMVMMIRPASLG